MAIPGYDPIGALGGLFAPAYIAGDPEAMAAAEAWFQKHKKTPPKDTYTPPVRPDTPAEEKKDAIDKVTEALMKQPYYPDLQGGDVADPMSTPPPGEPLDPVPGYPTTNNPLPASWKDKGVPQDEPEETVQNEETPPAQPVQAQPKDVVDPNEPDAQSASVKGGPPISHTYGQTTQPYNEIDQQLDNAEQAAKGAPQTQNTAVPIGMPPGWLDAVQSVTQTQPSIADQNAPNATPGKGDMAPGPQTALSPPSAPAPVAPVSAPTVSPNMENYGLSQIANPPTGFPAVSFSPDPWGVIDPWGVTPDEIANNTPNVNAWGINAPLDDLGFGLGIGKGGVPASQQLDQAVDAAKGKGISTDTDFSGQSKGTATPIDAVTEALMGQAVPLDLDPVTGEPVVDTQAPVSLDIDYGYGDLAPVGDPVSVDLGDLGGGTGGVTDAPDGTESTGGPGAGGASSATAAEASQAQAEAIGAMADALGVGDIGTAAQADAQSDLGGIGGIGSDGSEW